jgi:hypothetical protein
MTCSFQCFGRTKCLNLQGRSDKNWRVEVGLYWKQDGMYLSLNGNKKWKGENKTENKTFYISMNTRNISLSELKTRFSLRDNKG